MSRRAVILAGGQGKRLRPYTVVLPKPLMPIGKYPILEVIIKQLIHYNFTHITLAVNHQADIIKAFFGDGSKWRIKIDYSLEEKPLSTMGPLRLIPDLPENFLVMNGDILTDLNFKEFLDYHVSSDSLFTVSAFDREHMIDYGVLELDRANNLREFKEKPTSKYTVSMGIYAVNRRVLNYIPQNTAYGFDDLMHELLLSNESVNVKKYSGYWLDIGRPDDYMQAIDEFNNQKHRFLEYGE